MNDEQDMTYVVMTNKLAAQEEQIAALERKQDALNEAVRMLSVRANASEETIRKIARQKLSTELEEEEVYADYQNGFDTIVLIARAALEGSKR